MRALAWLILFATLVLWSGNWIVGRAVREEIAPGFATAGRLAIVVALLAPFVGRSLLARAARLTSAQWRPLLLLGFCGGGIHLALQWQGLHYTTATSATLYLSTGPVFILLFAQPLLGERITLVQWVGVALSFCGVALIGTQGEPALVSFNAGDALALASMAMWSAYTVFLRMRSDGLDTPEFLTLLCLMGLAWIAPWVAWEIWAGKKVALSPAGAAAIAYSALGSLLLAYAGWSYVVTRLGAARAGASLHLVPAIAVALAALFLGEYPRWFHFAGIALILAGVALSAGLPALSPPQRRKR